MPTHNRLPDETRNKIREAVSYGKRIADVAAEFGCSDGTVRNILKEGKAPQTKEEAFEEASEEYTDAAVKQVATVTCEPMVRRFFDELAAHIVLSGGYAGDIEELMAVPVGNLVTRLQANGINLMIKNEHIAFVNCADCRPFTIGEPSSNGGPE